MASRIVAYCLLLTMGVFGAHHFYLGRSLHGFVMMCSLGGFLVGWLHDLLNLERYIAESEDPLFMPDYQCELREHRLVQQALKKRSPDDDRMEQPARDERKLLKERRTRLEVRLSRSRFFKSMQKDSAPKYSWSRYFGEALFGLICGTLWLAAFPPEWFDDKSKRQVINLTWPVPVAFELGDLRLCIEWLTPLPLAIGVFLVGNIGTHRMSFHGVLICSYASFVVYSSEFNNILYGCLLTASLANWFCRGWRMEPPRPRSRCGRVCAVSAGSAMFYALLVFSLLNNAQVTYEGESVPLREAVKNFFKSPLWREMTETLGKLYEYYKIHGFKEILKQLWDAFDPQGLKDAASVIGLKSGAGPDEIRARCRKLKVELHPDKQKDPDKKQEFQAKFQEVSAACDVLQQSGKPRRRDL